MNRLFAAVLLAAFAACAYAKKEPPKTAEQLSADHGYLRVSLPQWEYASDFKVRHHGGKGEVQEIELKSLTGARSLGGWLPAGEYDVVDMTSPKDQPIAPIVVKPGVLTDLGVVLRVPLGGYEYVLLPIVDGEVDAEIAAALAKSNPHFDPATVIRWRSSQLPGTAKYRDPSSNLGLIADLLVAHDRKVNKPPLSAQLRAAGSSDALLVLAKSSLPPRTEEAGADADGNLYYGADLGQVRVRRTDGSWGAIDTGSLTEITAVEVSASRLVAGDLRGALRSSDDGGKTWHAVRQLGEHQVVLDIDRVGTRWIVLSADFVDRGPIVGFVAGPPGTPRGWTLGARMHVYSGVQDDLGDLASIREVELQQPGPTAGYVHIRGVADTYAGQAANGFYFISSLHRLLRLDLANLQWTELDPGHRVDSIRISTDGKLITAKRLQGAFSKVSVSSDNGASWVQYGRPPYTMYDVALETSDSGEATRWNSNAFSVQLEFYEYDPRIKDWRKAHESPPGCVQMLRDAAYHQRFCLTSGGSILVRNDGKWSAEFALE